MTSNTFVNNRLQGWSYDADGGLTNDGNVGYTRDAAGRYVQRGTGGTYNGSKFDGDGRLVGTSGTNPVGGTAVTYYLNSSLLGLAVAKLYSSGQRIESYVYAGGRKLATATPWQLIRSHVDPITGSHGHSVTQGGYGADAEFNADGVDVGFAEPTQEEPEFAGFEYPEVVGGTGCYPGNPNCVTVFLDGIEEHDWGRVAQLIANGARQCPDNDCGPRVINGSLRPLTLTQDSRTGLPVFGHWERTDVTVIDPTTGVRISGGPGTPHFIRDFASVNFLGFGSSFGKVGISPQKTAEFLPVDLDNIRRGLAWYLVNPDCAGFINDLLNRVTTGDNPRARKEGRDADILDIFDIVRGRITRESNPGGGQALGNIEGGDASIKLSPTLFGGNPSAREKATSVLETDIRIVLHEIIHLSGRRPYHDNELAVAVAAMTGTQRPGPTGRGPLSDAFQDSTFWDNELRKHCKDFKVKL